MQPHYNQHDSHLSAQARYIGLLSEDLRCWRSPVAGTGRPEGAFALKHQDAN